MAQAREVGVSWERLQGDDWRRIGPGQYVRREAATDLLRLKAVKLRLPDGAVFAGRTAGWLHGLDLDPTHPIEVIAPLSCQISARAGVSVRQAQLDADEIGAARGLPATSPIRTVGDLAWLLSLIDAVAAADAALHQRLLGLDDLWHLTERRSGRQGVGRLRRVLELAEPLAESPMETRLRLLLVFAGLPRPQAQVSLNDRQGRFVGRADLYYPNARLVVEFDGATHRDSLVEDSRRQNRILAAGYQLLRFTSADVLKMPDSVTTQVRRALTDLPANRAI